MAEAHFAESLRNAEAALSEVHRELGQVIYLLPLPYQVIEQIHSYDVFISSSERFMLQHTLKRNGMMESTCLCAQR